MPCAVLIDQGITFAGKGICEFLVLTATKNSELSRLGCTRAGYEETPGDWKSLNLRTLNFRSASFTMELNFIFGTSDF